jgi:hypothetical protein
VLLGQQVGRCRQQRPERGYFGLHKKEAANGELAAKRGHKTSGMNSIILARQSRTQSTLQAADCPRGRHPKFEDFPGDAR